MYKNWNVLLIRNYRRKSLWYRIYFWQWIYTLFLSFAHVPEHPCCLHHHSRRGIIHIYLPQHWWIVCRCSHLDLDVGMFSSCWLSYMNQLLSLDIISYHIGTGVPGLQWVYRIGGGWLRVGMLLRSTTILHPSWLALWLIHLKSMSSVYLDDIHWIWGLDSYQLPPYVLYHVNQCLEFI